MWLASCYRWYRLSKVDGTIPVKIYWEFRLFPRFSKFEVPVRNSILGYLLNVIGYFNLGGVYRLQGYIFQPCWNIFDLLDPEIGIVGMICFWFVKFWNHRKAYSPIHLTDLELVYRLPVVNHWWKSKIKDGEVLVKETPSVILKPLRLENCFFFDHEN